MILKDIPFFTYIKNNLLLIIILCVGAFLRFDRLGTLMAFIGDQGWFYLSARDMILTGKVPLVGITSSHTWLHQGPLWTYMLAGVLWVSNFHPVSGAILTSLIGVGTVFLIYRIGSDFFSENLGLVASLLYATSPLVIIHARMPYHTSPIPFFVSLLIYSFIKTIKGNSNWFPVSLLSISLLYNFELATVVFMPIVIGFLATGFIRKEKWFAKLSSKKNILFSILALLMPMIPIFIYDFEHGFPQTLKFGAWFVYKGLQIMGFVEGGSSESFMSVIEFFINKLSLLIFLSNMFVSLIIFCASLIFSAVYTMKKNKVFSALSIIFWLTMGGLIGFFAAKVRSEAYLPMLFPEIILLISFSFYFLKSLYFMPIVIIISFLNILFIVNNNYLMNKSSGYGISLGKRIDAIERILEQSNGQGYNIVGRGEGSKFKSFTMNYEYIAWWLGDAPSKKKEKLEFIIKETPFDVIVEMKAL